MGRSLTLAAALAAASFAVFAGCGGAAPAGPLIVYDACQPLAISPDPGITDAQATALAAGLALWNDRAGTKLSVATGSAAAGSTDAGIASLDGGAASPTVPLHFQGAAPPFHGLYDGGEIFINTDLAGAPESVVIAHEVGHAFGLVHIAPSERPSVMNPGNMMIEPTSSDIDTLAMRWGYCE